jgi:hypothetical protein
MSEKINHEASRVWGLAQTVGTYESNGNKVVIDVTEESPSMYLAIGMTQAKLLRMMEDFFGTPKYDGNLIIFSR